METKIKLGGVNSDSLIQTKEIKLKGGRRLQTPVKVVDLNRVTLKYNLPNNAMRLNEIFRRVDPEYLDNYDENPDFEEKENQFFNRLSSRVTDSKSVKICILEYNGNGLPTSDMIETLTDISYPYSDIIPLPLIPGLRHLSKSELKEYITFSSKCIDVIEQLNDKPIMGIIPFIQLRAVPKIIEFYLDKGINSFAIDLNGGNPSASYPRLRRIFRTIKDIKPIEECFIHAHNVGPGRPNKPAEVIPAKDILGLWLKFDSIGDRHKRWAPNRYFAKSDREEYKFRLFNKENYGYWRGLTAGKIKNICPDDSTIPTTLFKTYSNKTFVKNLFNIEQLALEANRIVDIANKDSTITMDYLNSKNQVLDDDLKKITKLNKEIS